jgi:small subunit ribosomal protein S16
MALKLRLTRMGNKKRAFYRLVAMNSTSRRDGPPLEFLGHYNPMVSPADVSFDMDKVQQWLAKGAQPTDTVRALLQTQPKG